MAFASIDPSDRRRELNNNALGFEEVSWRIIIYKIRIAAVFFLVNSRASIIPCGGTEPVLVRLLGPSVIPSELNPIICCVCAEEEGLI